jgi:hypothetical protein
MIGMKVPQNPAANEPVSLFPTRNLQDSLVWGSATDISGDKITL